MSFSYSTRPDSEQAKKSARRIYWAAWIGAASLLFVGPFFVLPPDWLFGWYFLFCNFFFGPITEWLAEGACRLAGVSQEGETHEVIERDARAALVPFLGAPPEFDVKVMLWRQATVDREGIETTHTDGKWRRVLWRDVETCTFSGERNALGHYTSATLTLQGSHELPLLQLSSYPGDADRLLSAIHFYLRGEDSPPKPTL